MCFFELQQKNPEKKFYSVGHRQFCPNMKKVTLERVEEALEKMQPYVEVPQDVLEAAAKPLKENVGAGGKVNKWQSSLYAPAGGNIPVGVCGLFF